MEKEYTYSAFISYSSKDEKVAKALWKKLEHYRLPAVLQKQYEDIPEKMHIFLDQGDIVPGDTVENALSRELADSKKLIVICSHNSAKSPYVELEVKNFLSLGHSPNDIIPYIIEGEVNRDSPNNCYVPSLFGKTDKETINGVSVLRDGKWKAFVGVLANLLDVKFDTLFNREKIRKRTIVFTWAILILVLTFITGIIFYYSNPLFIKKVDRVMVDHQGAVFETEIPKWVELIADGRQSQSELQSVLPNLDNKKLFVVVERGNNLDFIKNWSDYVEIENQVSMSLCRNAVKIIEVAIGNKENLNNKDLNMYNISFLDIDIKGLERITNYWIRFKVTNGIIVQDDYYEYYTIWAMDSSVYEKQLQSALSKIEGASEELKSKLTSELMNILVVSNNE